MPYGTGNKNNLANIKENRVRYNAREFDELKANLIQYAKSYFPNSYRDFNEASPGMMLIEMSAYVGDVLNFYIDKQYQEMLLPLATERKNIINLAKMLGFKYSNCTPAYTELTFTQEFDAITTDIRNIRPDWSQATTIPKGTKVTQGSNIIFETLDVVDFSVSSSIDSGSVVQSQVDSNGIASKFSVTRKVKAVGAETRTSTKVFSTAEKFNTMTINDDKLIEILSCTDTNGNDWYEVDYLVQDRVPIETHYTSDDDRLTAYTPLSGSSVFEVPVPYKLQYVKTTKRFTVHKDENYNTILTFGNGIIRNGQTLETTFLQTQQVGINIPGVTDDLTDAIDPTLGDAYDTLGEIPTNTTLTVTYRTAGNVLHNVNERSLTTHNYTGANAAAVSVTNLEPARGASETVSTREIKEQAMAHFKAQNRCVTREDYEARILNMDSRFGGVAKVYADRDTTAQSLYNKVPNLELLLNGVKNFVNDVANGDFNMENNNVTSTDLLPYFDLRDDGIIDPADIDAVSDIPTQLSHAGGTVNIHLLCKDRNNMLSDNIPSMLFANITSYLNEFRILTDDVTLKPGKVINFGVVFDVVANKFTQKHIVKARCIEKIREYFSQDNMQFRTPIYVNQIEYELMSIEGVRAVNHVTITQNKDWRAVDTPDVFNLGDSPGLFTKYYDLETGGWSTLDTNLGYGYEYDFSKFYDNNAVGSSLVGDGIILPSIDPSVFELKNFRQNIKGIVR